ncbi:MLO protein homolog 1-like isoform X2 [Diospyros lotus]|uniref:MLO protein homolog 1-like isoform X2 n=1 Tax=Diospyros lotus TaxID=55363 RepID=UPI00224F7415|nr:MLO protein homolog 1-like isoform X2 [Diospyros lotus]
MAGKSKGKSLEETATWAIALVCAVFVIISILIEHGIHSLGKWFQKRRNKSMSEALEKIKAELMILGFVSLLLTVGMDYITSICIPVKLGNRMVPCGKKEEEEEEEGGDDEDVGGDQRRKLLSYARSMIRRRLLAEPSAYGKDYCANHGKMSLISYSAVHELHIFIFVLAIFHVLYSVITIALAQAKMKKWKAWEAETSSLEYQFTNDPARFRFVRQTSFVRRHAGFSRAPGIRWIVAFFRLFFGSVSKIDYMTMRHGFINKHFAPNSKFDFHKYIKRSMEDDFKVVVGINIPLWIFAVCLLLMNVYRWYTLGLISLVPLIIILLVGTKLELVIMEMAQQIEDRTSVIRGAPVVEPSNSYFWFNRPQWILVLIHFTVFQNAFQMALFLWTLYEYGRESCLHENLIVSISRVLLAVALQFLCSYITFPLYALVTTMGSHMKQAIFEEQTAKALKKWQKAAKDRNKQRRAGGADGSSNAGSVWDGENTPSRGTSPLHLLHKHRPSETDQLESAPTTPLSCPSEAELSETEGSSHGSRLEIHLAHDHRHPPASSEEAHAVDFSFVKT